MAEPRREPASEQLERLAALSPGLLAIVDAEGRITLAGGGWQRMLGWTQEQVTGRHWHELVHPADLEASHAASAPVRTSNGAEPSFECRLATSRGGWRWISWRLRHEEGSWYAAGQDTTERHGAEQELRRSEARFEEAQEVAGVGSFELDLDSRELWLSRESRRIHGLDPLGPPIDVRSALALAHPDDRLRVRDLYETAADSTSFDHPAEYRIRRPDGDERVVQAHSTVVEGPAGLHRVLGTIRDVSEQRRAEQALEAGQRRLQALVDQVPAIVYTASLGTDVQWDYVSPQVESMLGYRPQEWITNRRLWFEAIHPDDRDRALADEGGISSPTDTLRSEYRLRHRDGHWIWVRDEATVIENEHGELRFQGVLLDITEAKRAEAALAGSEERYRTVVQTSQDMIWAFDLEGRFTFVNDAVRTIHGYTPEEMIGRPYTDFNHPDVVEVDEQVAAEILAGQAYVQYETKHVRKDGSTVLLSFNATVLRDAEGNVLGAVGTARDVTATRAAEAAVNHKHAELQAIIDNSPLVIYAKDAQGRLLLTNREYREHLADDELLPAGVASRLREDDRKVLDTGCALEVEETVARHGRERTYLVHKFPLRRAGDEIYGVCAIATDVTEWRAGEESMRSKAEWTFRLRDAIDSDKLVLHSQPIVEVTSGKTVQEELLVRMRAGEGEGLIMPGEFLPPAERFGLAPAIDRWVVAEAVRLARGRKVEVNLSGQSIGDRTLPDFIEAQLDAHGAAPGNLVFEITETAAADDLDQARYLAERLVALGCGFALDDFGTGYGSFTYLRHLPVSYLKIDLQFVRNLHADAGDRQVVRAILDVARNFGMQTVAEGVESAEVMDVLETMGVDYAQGYHLGRPAAIIEG